MESPERGIRGHSDRADICSDGSVFPDEEIADDVPQVLEARHHRVGSPSAAATDIAGNACQNTASNEPGAPDPEF